MAKAKKQSKSVVDTSEYQYKTTKYVGKDGKTHTSRGNDDAVARAMLQFVASGKDLMQIVRANGLTDRLDIKKYDNVGLFRMSLGNALRGLVRNGTPVKIGDIEVKTLSQRIAAPVPPKKAAKTPASRKAA